ncbi:MAG: acyl-CoA thioesterase, partial [Pirellulales bacterium]
LVLHSAHHERSRDFLPAKPCLMPQPYRTTRRVELRDTDAAGIAHFSAFIQYMEQAEHEFLRHLGLSVLMHDDAGEISWPRVSVQCDYQGAVRFEDVVDVDLRLDRLGSKSATYTFLFEHAGRTIASGRMTSVCCRLNPHHPPQSIVIPPSIADKLRPWAD